MKLKEFKENVLKLVFPYKCPLCRRLMHSLGFCDTCRSELELRFMPRCLDVQELGKAVPYAKALFPYREISVKRSIGIVKWRGSVGAVKYFSEKASEEIRNDLFLSSCDVMTYVPRRRSSAREAGHDHCRLYIKEISRLTGMKWERHLKRRYFRFEKEQKGLNADERRRNVHGLFYCVGDVKGKIVLLFDDVITTGADIKECSEALLKAGARKVYSLALASDRRTGRVNF